MIFNIYELTVCYLTDRDYMTIEELIKLLIMIDISLIMNQYLYRYEYEYVEGKGIYGDIRKRLKLEHVSGVIVGIELHLIEERNKRSIGRSVESSRFFHCYLRRMAESHVCHNDCKKMFAEGK